MNTQVVCSLAIHLKKTSLDETGVNQSIKRPIIQLNNLRHWQTMFPNQHILSNPYAYWFVIIAAIYIAWLLTYLLLPNKHQWIPSILGVIALCATWVYMYMVLIPLFILATFFLILPMMQYHKR